MLKGCSAVIIELIFCRIQLRIIAFNRAKPVRKRKIKDSYIKMLHSCYLSIICIRRGTEGKASSLMHNVQNMLAIPMLSLLNHSSWERKMKKCGFLKASKEVSGTWISTGRWQHHPSIFAAFLSSHLYTVVEVEEMGRTFQTCFTLL